MRIALVIDSLEFGGSESVAQRLATGLAARGHTAFIYCLQSAAVPLAELARAGVVVREARAFGHAPLLPLTLGRWLRADRVEVVHAHSCAGYIWSLPAARFLELPILHVWHGWPLGRLGRYPWLAAQLARAATQIGVNSAALAARLPHTRPFRAPALLPNGVDLPPVERAAARAALEQLCRCELRGPVVLAVGNIRREKDQRTLLAAFAGVRARYATAQLVCVGLHQEAEYWRTVADDRDRLGLHGCAHFPGGAADAWRLMPGADVFCLSSTAESLPNVVIEAMCQRTPVVATAVGDVGRLAGSTGPALLTHRDTGLLVPPASPAALADALAEALGDGPAAARRAARAHAHYRAHYTTARMVTRYLAMYEALRARRGVPRALALPERATAPTRGRHGRVLMVGPHPTELGGMVTAVDLLLRSPLRTRFVLRRFATTPPRRTPAGARTGRVRVIVLGAGLARHALQLLRFGAALVEQRIDLVHIHTCSHFTFWRNLLDLALARLLRRPVLLHIRGGQFAEFCRSAAPWQQRLIRAGCAAAAGIVVLSPRWREALRPWMGTTPVHVIPNAVRVPRAERHYPRQSSGTCRFLYLALLTRAKGLEDLLEAAVLLKGAGVPFELVLAGPAPEEPLRYWLARVHALGLADCVRFMGAVRGTAKSRLLDEADCFVHPSHTEALPNAVLEAAAAGLPVIATGVGSLPEVLGTELGPVTPLVPARAVAELAAELARMALDEQLRRETGVRLQAHIARTCSLPRVAARIARVYTGVLGRRCASPGKAPAQPGPWPEPALSDSPPAAEAHAVAPLTETAR